MKKLLLIAILSFGWLACSSGSGSVEKIVDKDGFHIKGKVKFPGEGMVVLQKMENTGIKGIDSVKLGPNNSFEFKGKISEPGFYSINLFKKQNIILVLDKGEQLEITADGNAEKGAFTVKGSKGSDYLVQINRLKDDFEAKAAQLTTEYTAANEKQDAATQQKIKDQFMGMKKTNVEAVKKLIDEMGTSIASLYATNFLNPEEEADMQFLSKLAKRFEKEAAHSAYAKDFVNQIKDLEKKMALSPSIGKQAPEITLNNVDGKQVSLSSLRGKYVLIDFWASWCSPCRQENPNVVRMYNKFKGKDFEILGVSLDQDKAKWLAAIEKDKLTWMHVSDLKGWQSAGGQAYQVQSIPATFLIDKTGKIIAKNLRGEELERKMEEVLNMK
ncbi:MAG: TlpA disulfide reductase family protein [Bacteroidota bacterium]